MRPRQFQQLAGLPIRDRDALVVEGLQAIGRNVSAISAELQACDDPVLSHAARLLRNVGREEAGKFLVLLDVYRAPGADQEKRSRQFRRAGDHLCKLIYAQIADYSIGSSTELLDAVALHRKELHLDGPNDVDWIFRNDLLMEREGALYVDLIDHEGELAWLEPHRIELHPSTPTSMRLVQALSACGIDTLDGLHALTQAWTAFDAAEYSHCSAWGERTRAALAALGAPEVEDDTWRAARWLAIDRWPMPMVDVSVEQERVDLETLRERRQRALYEQMG
jgi:hypothetical protein